MAMNIKSAAAHDLARQIAQITGESITAVVEQSLREKLARVDRKGGLADRLMAIGKDCAPRLAGIPDHAELLYDDRGFPK